ncbi:hypothetical protein MP228_003673 [Amoeboaphelidium protococcarum]|nr:hypothetical protein MP228_003673 [Amoeboaphelidium protococcarum]
MQIRSKPFITATVFEQYVLHLIKGARISFSILPIFGVLQTLYRSELSVLIVFIVVATIGGVCLVTMDMMYLYTMTMYIRNLKQDIQSPNEQFYSIIARSNSKTVVLALFGASCGLVCEAAPQVLVSVIFFTLLNLFMIAILYKMVMMKSDLGLLTAETTRLSQKQQLPSSRHIHIRSQSRPHNQSVKSQPHMMSDDELPPLSNISINAL